jgi:prepilin-type N-terminal cleavage/methylation domain-containing protein
MNQKGWTLMELLVAIFVVLILVAFIWSLGSVMKGCSDTIDIVEKQGLKAVIERVWEGEQKEQ